jgi:hypothetical protein
MPTVFHGPNWKITMYFRDHPPPHFHVITSAREEAQVRIDDFCVLAGRIPPKILTGARQWAELHVGLLHEKWNELHP